MRVSILAMCVCICLCSMLIWARGKCIIANRTAMVDNKIAVGSYALYAVYCFMRIVGVV